MKKNLTKILILLNIFVLSFISSSNSYAQSELNLYNWGDYINPAVLEKFEDASLDEVISKKKLNDWF